MCIRWRRYHKTTTFLCYLIWPKAKKLMEPSHLDSLFKTKINEKISLYLIFQARSDLAKLKWKSTNSKEPKNRSGVFVPSCSKFKNLLAIKPTLLNFSRVERIHRNLHQQVDLDRAQHLPMRCFFKLRRDLRVITRSWEKLLIFNKVVSINYEIV